MALYHSARGSVDYTIVGSPTIVDGVASDFSSSNYLKTDATFSQDVYNAWIQNSETVVKFRTNALQAQHIIYIPTGGGYAGFYMRGSQGKINWQIYSTSYRISPDFVFSVNTDYWLKGTISNGVATFSYSTDGTNYTTLGTLDLQGITDPGSYTSYVQFGYGSAELGPVNGSIDLNHTYITVNGQPWFGICPIEVKKHQLMGPVGYTITGTGPTVTDGILTGVGGASSVYTSQTIPSFETFELVTKVKKNGLSPNEPLPALALSSTAGDASYRVVAGGILSLRVGSSTPVISLDNFPYASLTGEWFYIRLNVGKNGNNYNYSIGYSTDKQNWTTGTGISSSVFTQAIGFLRNSSGNGGASSYMDFNETYIKINGNLWFWQPQPTKYIQRNNQLVWADQKLYLSVPATVGLTSVGTPTISDGVVSDFSSGNYIQTAENFSFKNPLEICFTATTSSDVNTSQLFCSVGNGGSNRSFGITIESGGKMGVAYTLNGSSWVGWLPSSYVFEGNTKYNFLIQYVPSQYFTIKVKKLTETSWTTFTNSLSAPIYTSTNCPFIFGQNYQNKPFLGSIDLKETYIKMDDVMWFQYPQTVTYTKVGNPAMVDNVASKFSLTDYLHVGNPFKPSNLPWEIQTVFKLDYPGSRKNVALTNSTLADYVFPKLAVQTESNSTLGVQALLSSNGTSGDINASSVIVSYDYSKKGYINLKFVPTSSSSGDYILSFKQEGGSFTQIATYSNKSIIFQNQNDTAFTIGADIGAPSSWRSAFIGSIYLDETYFKINNQLWFYGKNYATQNIAPVPVDYPLTIKGPANYIVVGSPTITDGVISNMDGNNYVKMSSMPPFGNKDFEIKVVVNANVKKSMRIISNNVTAATMTSIVVTNTSGAIKGSFYDGTNIYDVTAPSAGNLVTGSKFYINFYRNGTTLGIKTSTDNTNWNEATTTIPSTSSFANNGSVFSLSAVSQGIPFDGSIYLDETYIKINGQPWFGKAYPVPTTGYVDIPTQVFTAAPEGAVVGRDE